MKIGQVKTVQIDHAVGLAGSTAKATEAAEFLESGDPTQQAVHDFFSAVSGRQSDYAYGDPTSDPTSTFQTIRAALEGATQTPPEAYSVPTAEELHIKYPSGNLFADGGIETEYQKLKNAFDQRLWDLNQQKGNGALSPSQHKAIQAEVAQIQQALSTLAEEMGNARQIAINTRELYQKELDLVPKVGTGLIDPLSADLNYDGIVGDPNGVHYLAGKRENGGVEEYALLDPETKFEIRYTPDGAALTKTTLNPAYTCNLVDADKTGLKMVPSNNPTAGELTLEWSGAALNLATYAGSKNIIGTDINFTIPESIVVQTNAAGKAMIDANGNYSAYMPEDGYDGTFKAPLDENGHVQEGFMQMQVADVELRGGNKEHPNDVFVVMKDANGQQLFEVKLQGAATKRLMFSDGSGKPNGLLSDKKDPNTSRTSPVHFHVASDFRKVLTDPSLHSDFYMYFKDANGGSVSEETVFPNGTLSSDNTIEVNGIPGIAVVGLTGVLEGTQFNDIFDVPPPPANVEKLDPDYATIVKAGAGYNGVFASYGDLYATGVTYLSKDSGERQGDYTYVQTPGLLELYGSKKEESVKYGANPKITVHVKTLGGHVDVDNLVEEAWGNDTTMVKYKDDTQPRMNKYGPIGDTAKNTTLDGAGVKAQDAMYTGDDDFDINTGNTYYSNYKDFDVAEVLDGSSQLDPKGAEKAIADARKKVMDVSNGKGPVDEKGEAIVEEAWESYGPLYNEAQTEMSAFFGEYSSWSGVPDTTSQLVTGMQKKTGEEELDQALKV